MAIKTKKITLTPAQIYTLYSARIIILPAPPAGLINNILGASFSYIYQGIIYDTYPSLLLSCILSPDLIVMNTPNILNYAGTVIQPFSKYVSANTPFTTKEDFIVWKGTDSTVGNTPVDIYLIYEEIALVI